MPSRHYCDSRPTVSHWSWSRQSMPINNKSCDEWSQRDSNWIWPGCIGSGSVKAPRTLLVRRSLVNWSSAVQGTQLAFILQSILSEFPYKPALRITAFNSNLHPLKKQTSSSTPTIPLHGHGRHSLHTEKKNKKTKKNEYANPAVGAAVILSNHALHYIERPP